MPPIMGEIPFDGHLKIGHNVSIGYYAQNQAQLLDGELSVFDTIDHVAKGDIRLKIRDILGAFMFGGEASDKKVKVLSGGERSRLAMIKLLLEPVNLLILDEPTNHLDMRTKDVLKEAILAFDGTVIVVSHDRDFLDGLVEKVYEFGDGKVREHLGGIYDFLQKKEIESLDALNKSNTMIGQSASATSPKQKTASDGKLSYAEHKELARQRKRAEKLVEECEQRVMQLEEQKQSIEQLLATPEGTADAKLFDDYAHLQQQLKDAEDAWEQALEQLS